MAPDKPGEIILRLVQRRREDAQQVRREPFVRAVDGDQRPGGPRRRVGIDVGRIGVRRLRQVRKMLAVVVHGPEEEGLAEIGRRVLAQRIGEARVAKPWKPRWRAWAGRAPAVLPGARQVEEGPRPLEGAFDDRRVDAVAGDDEEAEAFAGPGHGAGHRRLVPAVEEGRDVDDRDGAAHRAGPGSDSAASTASS